MTELNEKRPPAPRREPMILDMGLGSREQSMPSQKPALPLGATRRA